MDRVRDDKAPEQCTTVSEIMEMYAMQVHDSDGLDAESEWIHVHILVV